MNKATMTPSPLNILMHIAALMAVLLLASNVSAQDCASDADCGEGFVCDIWASGGAPIDCTVDSENNESCFGEDPVEEYGECVRGPVECDSNEDCPSGLTCVFAGVPEPAPAPDCAEGDDCPENNGLWEGEDPAPEVGYCEWIPQACGSDADCGEGFECQVIGSSDCAAPACPPGEDCPDIDCEPVAEESACVPREIECDTDAQCPSDWSCVTFSAGYCEGSGSDSGGASEGEGFAPEPENNGSDNSDNNSNNASNNENNSTDEDPDGAEEEFCYEEVRSLCAPPGWDHSDGGGFPGTDNGSHSPGGGQEGENNQDAPLAPGDNNDNGSVFDNDDSAQNGGEDDEDGGGCTVSSVNGQAGGTGALMLLLGMMLVAARRRK